MSRKYKRSMQFNKENEQGSSTKKMKERATKKTECSLDEYIKMCKLSDNDPGLLFSWEDALFTFVSNCNGLAAPPQPPWITTAAGNMTALGFQQDVISHLRLVGGGSYGRVLVAPNTLLQSCNVMTRLSHIETDPFVQAGMAGIPVGGVLASTAVLSDKRVVTGTPSGRIAPPPPHRLVFS